MGNEVVIQHSCPKCKHVTTPKGKALTLSLTCEKCGVYYCVHTNANDQFLTKFIPALAIRSRGKIKGVLYEVMGFAVKREKKYEYQWREYFLFNPNVGIAFLSEYDGNWNFLKPYSKHPLFVSYTATPTIEKGKFQLYAKYHAEVLYASGEFFTDIIGSNESSTHYEHICPPYILNFEESNSQLGAYLGEYISPALVATGFNLDKKNLPPKKGLGYTQPHSFSVDESLLLTISVVTLLAAFFLQWILNETAINKKVFESHFVQADLNGQKMFTTSSFQLEGDQKNVVIKVKAPLSNDWFFAEYSLINDATDQEYIFTNEFEYYNGTEEGEAWSEGSNMGDAFLSSIPKGKYHINIYPEFSTSNHEFTISIFRDTPFYSNFFVLCFLLCLFPAAFYGYRYYREQKRWEDSEYSTYE